MRRKTILALGLALVMMVSAVTGTKVSGSVMALENVKGCIEDVVGTASADAVKIASIQNPVLDASTVTFSYVYFGSYPQSEVTGEALMEKIIDADYASSGIVSEMTNIDEITNYAISGEAIVMGEKYRRMAGEDGSYRYFKYEPIKWRVMNVENGVAQLRSDVALDSRPCLYLNRRIEDWLNSEIVGKETFMDCAFTRDEVRSMTTEIAFWEYDALFGEKGLLTKASDYTWCCGVMDGNRSSEYVEWWAENDVDMEACYVNVKGELCDNYSFMDSGEDYNHYRYSWEEEGVGVCPVIHLNLSETDYWYTENEIQEAVNYEITDIRNYKNDMQVQCAIPEECKVIVACYNNQGKMEAYGSTELRKGTTSAYVALQGNMEKGTYLVKAFLVDKENYAPLCSEYIKTVTDIGIQRQGKCGDNIFYTLDYNGNLELYGSGGMYDYTNFSYLNPVYSPFAFHNGIHTIVIGDGIERIGNYAFYFSNYLEKVQFSDSVVEIGINGFDGCGRLEQIQLPDSLQILGLSAFEDCMSLKEVNLPEGLISIGRRAFYKCKSLESVYMPDTVTAMSNQAFGECVSLKNVRLSSGLTKISESVFYYCDSLENIVFPEGITTLESSVLGGCDNIKSITLPRSLVTIDEDPFGCSYDDYIVYVYEGSYAEDFLKSVGKEYLYIDEVNQENNTTVEPTIEVTTKEAVNVEDNDIDLPKTVVTGEAVYSNLEAGEDYFFVIVKEKKQDFLDGKNVLYINQYTADSADMKLPYVLDETVNDYNIMIFTNSEKTPVLVYPKETMNPSEQPIASQIPMVSEMPSEQPLVTDNPIVSPNVPVKDYLAGDINGDGKVTLEDAQLTLKAALKIMELKEEQMLAADMNQDKYVTLEDAQKVLRKALKIQ